MQLQMNTTSSRLQVISQSMEVLCVFLSEPECMSVTFELKSVSFLRFKKTFRVYSSVIKRVPKFVISNIPINFIIYFFKCISDTIFRIVKLESIFSTEAYFCFCRTSQLSKIYMIKRVVFNLEFSPI